MNFTSDLNELDEVSSMISDDYYKNIKLIKI